MFRRKWPGSQQVAEQWDDVAGTYTAWDPNGVQLVTRPLAPGETIATGAESDPAQIWLRAGMKALQNNFDALTAGVTGQNVPAIAAALLRQTGIMMRGMAFMAGQISSLQQERTPMPVATSDPPSAQPGDMWYRSDLSQLCVMEPTGAVRRSATFT